MSGKGDAEEDMKEYRWETEYERTWEAIRENEEGLLQPSVDDIVNKAKRKRILNQKKLRLGMMRHLYLVVDMSECMQEHDLKPSRILCCLKLLQLFVKDFFDLNPISQIGIIVTRNKRREKISELSGNPKVHEEAINKLMDVSCVGEPSLQNAIVCALETLKYLPSHTSKEVLIIFGSLTTCDPSDITQTIELLSSNNIRCSVIGLAAEVKICHTLAKMTKGTYNVALDDNHLKELLFDHLNPPPATANTESSLIRMGFPQYYNEEEGKPSMCVCHLSSNINFSTEGYFCPQCNAKYCDLPVECQVCGLTLASSTHLSRSYHHLFPIDLFKPTEYVYSTSCFSCQLEIKNGAKCEHCNCDFCIDCDVFIHETMHLCPGCASLRV